MKKKSASKTRRKFLKHGVVIIGSAIIPSGLFSRPFQDANSQEKLTLIKNGLIVNHNEEFTGDILISGEKIAEIGKHISKRKGTSEVIDASGMHIMPGGVDPHVQVTTGRERIIIASDNVWFYHNIDKLLSATITFDTTAYINQMKRMKTLASEERFVIPGHDVKIFERFPVVTKGVAKISRN